ncbi:MAG: FMN-binding protein [Coriobacteriales bacterium]|nr:FMN-binding protein [Coriobacteriales bacterium]
MSSKKTGTVLPVVVLVVICVVAAALLAVVHQVTEPVITQAEEQKALGIYTSLFPNASTFEDTGHTSDSCLEVMRAQDASNKTIGYVVVAQGKGYGGQVPLVVAFDAEGTVLDLVAMDNDETPGLGSKACDPTYLDQYVGKSAHELGEGDVDLISGATITSKAVLSAFNAAVEAYEEVC